MQCRILYLFTISILFLTACQQRMLFPNQVTAPAFKKGGEMRLTGSIIYQNDNERKIDSSKPGEPIGFAGDAAVSVTDHFLLFGSYKLLNRRYVAEGDNKNAYNGMYNGYNWDAGFGLFKELDDVNKRKTIHLLIGFGKGRIDCHDEFSPWRDYNTRYFRVFLQPSFSYSRSCYRLTSGARLFYQQFYNFHSIDPNLKNHVFTDDFHSNVEKQSLLFFQPFVNMEIGWRYVSFFAQVNFNTQYSNPDYGSGINPYLAAGLAFRLSPDFNNR